MREPVIIVGLGQMGGTFAHGFLRTGSPVVPVTRTTRWTDALQHAPAPALAMLAVGESALGPVLEGLPPELRSRVGLLQNELLPPDWEGHGIDGPTVAVVWFEKKRDTPVRVIRPTVLAGPQAPRVAETLESLAIPTLTVDPGEPLVRALVAKNLYILTTNLAGLEVGGSVGELWGQHRGLAEDVARDVLALQEGRLGRRLPREALVEDMAEAFAADPSHGCRGRSAPARLSRCLADADARGLPVPTLRRLAKHIS
jgi:hypothetical protein